MQETQEAQGQSLGQEGPLREGMAIHSSVLAQKILWTEEPGRIQSIGTQLDTTEAAEHACMHGLCHSFKGCALPTSFLFQDQYKSNLGQFQEGLATPRPFPHILSYIPLPSGCF